jgi:hypothetical protein
MVDGDSPPSRVPNRHGRRDVSAQVTGLISGTPSPSGLLCAEQNGGRSELT